PLAVQQSGAQHRLLRFHIIRLGQIHAVQLKICILHQASFPFATVGFSGRLLPVWAAACLSASSAQRARPSGPFFPMAAPLGAAVPLFYCSSTFTLKVLVTPGCSFTVALVVPN